MANRARGEMVARINGRTRIMKLSLDALARLETVYGGEDILTLVKRFSEKGLSATDVIHILRAGLIGASDPLGADDTAIDVEGGYPQALKLATELMELSFAHGSDEVPRA
jgi:hypothetical protein